MKKKAKKAKRNNLQARVVLENCLNAPTSFYAKAEQAKSKASIVKNSKKGKGDDFNFERQMALESISHHADGIRSTAGIYSTLNGTLIVEFSLDFGSGDEAKRCAKIMKRAVEGLRKKSLVALKSKLAAFNKKY